MGKTCRKYETAENNIKKWKTEYEKTQIIKFVDKCKCNVDKEITKTLMDYYKNEEFMQMYQYVLKKNKEKEQLLKEAKEAIETEPTEGIEMLGITKNGSQTNVSRRLTTNAISTVET